MSSEIEKALATLKNDKIDAEMKEQAIYTLANIYKAKNDANAMVALLRDARDFFSLIAKARTAKIVRVILDEMGEIAGAQKIQLEVCKENIEWAQATQRTYLRQRLQLKYYQLLHDAHESGQALAGLEALLRELKRLDDKPLLVESLLLESRIERALHSLAKSKAALTSARTNANAIYCPQKLQAELDWMNGVLNADEHDYKTGYSYFFEGFEAYDAVGDKVKALNTFKYMLMCKIMSGHTEDLGAIITTKNGQKYAAADATKAMQGIAKARRESSLHDFMRLREQYKAELVDDVIVCVHFDELYNTLLEQNLSRLIEPFSCVEIAHVAELIALPLLLVERRLSQMILDKKIYGILDQGAGTLILFDAPPSTATSEMTVQTIEGLNQVVDTLYDKATKSLA